MKYRLIILFSFLISSFITKAQKDTCKVGLYLSSVYDFDIEGKSFMTDFWVWMNYKNDELNFEDALEIPSCKSIEFSHYSLEKKNDINWSSQKGKAQVRYQWDVRKFPFDKQKLLIELEDAKYDSSQVVYIADTANSKIDRMFRCDEWNIESFSLTSALRTYGTTYGNPVLSGSSTYPRIVAELNISRKNSWILLAKMLTGAYVAFLISCLVFFVSSENQDSRFGLCVGGLFAAIGNKYIVESVVPGTSSNTLMDDVHNLTFTFILLIVGVIIVSLNWFESGDEIKKAKSLKLDRYAFLSILILYFLMNVFFIWRAVN